MPNALTAGKHCSIFSPNKPVPVSRIDSVISRKVNLIANSPPLEQPYMPHQPRSHIADSLRSRHWNWINPAIKKAAAGTTTFESNRRECTHVTEFFPNLIPFRSAVVNFMEGNYGEGITDVAFDVFGFVTAGVGMAAKIGKVLGTAGSGGQQGAQGHENHGAVSAQGAEPVKRRAIC